MNIEDDNNVDIDTDDLDAFSAELFGTSKPSEEDEEVAEEQVETPDVEDQLGDDEDDESEDIETPATEETDEDDEDEEEPEEEPQPKPKKKSAQERINELTAKAREAERREADVLRQLEELKKLVEQKETKEPEVKRPQFEEGAPNPDTKNEDGSDMYPLGEFDPAFIRDLTRYTIQKEQERVTKEAEEAQAAKAKTEAFETLKTEWNGKLDAITEELPDVREKITELDSMFIGIEPEYGEYLATTIMSLDHGPEVLYYLSQNVGEAQKIVAAGPTAATLALGRLEAQFLKPKTEKRNEKKVSKAPEPPQQRTRGSGVAKTVAPDTDDLDAFEQEFFRKTN